ncbi:hypothetical protein [Rhizorhabdus sp.]|uniref:hypothetical protein n=1 Tax=Rhizorhabdus sp. TaxID=1968843 RepID=UPI0035B3AF20
MSVEGMWMFRSASVENPNLLLDGGIIVLETGRVFGGDSSIAYRGSYDVSGGQLLAEVRTWTWNEALGVANVWGMTGKIDQVVMFEGQPDTNRDVIAGYIYPKGMPGERLAALLQKICNLD